MQLSPGIYGVKIPSYYTFIFFLAVNPFFGIPTTHSEIPVPFILSSLPRGKILDISIKMIFSLEPLLFPYLSEKYMSDVFYWMCIPNVSTSSLWGFHLNCLRPHSVEQSCNFHISLLTVSFLIQLSGSQPLLCFPPILWPGSCSVVFSILLYPDSGHRPFLRSFSGSWHQTVTFEGSGVWEIN